MSIRATFSYFQGMEGDMYQFYRIPKLLFTSEYFKNLRMVLPSPRAITRP